MREYDIVIIGAGIYGLYLANIEEIKNKKKLIIEIEDDVFKRASFINQARLHNGYHYPRSLQTSTDAHNYFNKFNEEFAYAVNSSFKNIYAIAKNGSLTNASEFEKVCAQIGIPLQKERVEDFFKKDMVEGAYSTLEYTFDAGIIKKKLLDDLKDKNADIMCSCYIKTSEIFDNKYKLLLSNNDVIETPVVINTTYASINCVNSLFNAELVDIKYELCEMALGVANEELQKYSFTIMDGNFFSTMPFPSGEIYSLTSVHYTPHDTCFKKLPEFNCQLNSGTCSSRQLGNCNNCPNKPQSMHKEMENLINDYLLDKFKFNYTGSMFTIKPIMKNAENDDARPTIIKTHRTNPTFISCLSGKISTIYIMKKYIVDNSKRWFDEN